ncbi:endoribonuclease [Sulfolobales archaeon HS-7]|nr:endoribonuclease [Sulfolobales archaeon HS-7]
MKLTHMETVFTEEAPKPIGPYSQGVKAGNLLFISGQIPINPKTGEIPPGIREQTRQVLENIRAILKASSLDVKNVVMSFVFLSDMRDFQEFNEEYSKYFTSNPPARVTVGVKELPRGSKVEISVIASQ